MTCLRVWARYFKLPLAYRFLVGFVFGKDFSPWLKTGGPNKDPKILGSPKRGPPIYVMPFTVYSCE